jgi:hypothetical protein
LAFMNSEEEAWNQAVSNQPSEAYSRLIALDCDRPESPDLALRLYWLLALQPELDPERSRHDWLAAALTRARLATPALELYKRELETNPDAGLSAPYGQLLKVDAASGNLLWVARQRLAAAGLKRLWEVIENDLNALSSRVAQLDEVAWLSFLAGVMAHVSFDRPAPVYEQCGNLLAALRHLEHRESWAFEQIEVQRQSALLWREAIAVPTLVREVVRDSWVAPFMAWKKTMSRASAWAAEDPASALSRFDLATRIPECQPILLTFQKLLDDCQTPRERAYPPGLIRGLVREFLLKNGRENYTGMRPELIGLLIRDAIDPHELVKACTVDSALGPRALVEHVRTDPALRLVWQTVFSAQG